jgi:hypothetical protein
LSSFAISSFTEEETTNVGDSSSLSSVDQSTTSAETTESSIENSLSTQSKSTITAESSITIESSHNSITTEYSQSSTIASSSQATKESETSEENSSGDKLGQDSEDKGEGIGAALLAVIISLVILSGTIHSILESKLRYNFSKL